MKELTVLITVALLGVALGAIVSVGLDSHPAQIPQAQDPVAVTMHELQDDRQWTAVLLGTGEYSVALCDSAGVCATTGTGTTGYRPKTAERAKEIAARLERIRNQPITTAEPIP